MSSNGDSILAMSTSALRCREIMVLTIIFVMACKFTIFPFLNRMDEMYSNNNIINNNNNVEINKHPTLGIKGVDDVNNNNNGMKISDQGEVASIKNLQDHHTKEIFRLQAEHNLKITDMMQQHTKEISHLQSQLMISKSTTEQCKYELKRNEEILLHEKKRLDSILMKNDNNNDDKTEEL